MKTQQAHLVDIVFENRNKSYGAYVIRQGYPVTILRALMLCVGVTTLIFLLPHHPSVKNLKNEVIIEPSIDLGTKPKIKIREAAPKDTHPIKKAINKLLVAKITTSDNREIEPIDIIETSSSAGEVDGLRFESPDGDGLGDFPIEIVPVKPEQYLVAAEVMPSYQGGIPEMIKFIQRKLRYPNYAARMGITGTVYVSFVVSTNGTITHVEIVKGIDKSCDEEAMRVISIMDKWKPGLQNKVPVAVRMVLPIKYVAGD